MSAVGGDRIAMRVSRDWDHAVVAGVCSDGEKTGGRVCFLDSDELQRELDTFKKF